MRRPSRHSSLPCRRTCKRPILPEEYGKHERKSHDAARAWQAELRKGGWAGISWPKTFGGRGASPIQTAIFAEEQARFTVSNGPLMVSINMVGPTLMAHGTEQQQLDHLEKIISGQEIWCQLYSEPGAGSDLASLRTRAVLDGDEYVVNGQKVWNSSARAADWAILLARTDLDVPKHRGITYFIVDMRTPGIDVRPLRQASGAYHFNEVFLTDVRIPVANVLGEPGEGWNVARTTLANERAMIGGGGSRGQVPALIELARKNGKSADPVVRQGIAEVVTRNADPALPRAAHPYRAVQGRAAGARSVGDEAHRRPVHDRRRGSGPRDRRHRRHARRPGCAVRRRVAVRAQQRLGRQDRRRHR